MYMSGMIPYSTFAFSIITMAIVVPSAIKTFNWLGTLWGGRIRLQLPMLFAIGFVSLFVSDGLSGPFLAQPVLDIPLHDTYFVVGHFHLIMGVAAIFGIFAATYYWFPKMFGRMMNERLGLIHFFLTFIFFNGTFFLMHIVGMHGHPRRIADPSVYHYLRGPGITGMNVFMTINAFLLGLSQLIFAYNFFHSLVAGPKAGANPWHAN